VDRGAAVRNDAAVAGQRSIGALTALGAVALPLACAAALIVALREQSGTYWVLPMATMFAVGALAARRRPDELAARRLLLLGAIAIVWFALGMLLGILTRRLEAGGWLVVPDTLEVALDLLLPAAILGLFAVYPDGRYQRRYEVLVVRAGFVLAGAVPLLLLLARPTLQPALSLGWLEPYAGPSPTVASPLHIEALGFLASPLSHYARAAIGLLTATAVALLALRYRRFDAAMRFRTRWPLAALGLAALQPIGEALVAVGGLPKTAVDGPVVIVLTALALALAIGLLAPDLFDLAGFLRRSLAYVALWLALAAAYVGVAAAAGAAASGEGLRVAVAVAIAVTLLAAPARRALARRAGRWVYGEGGAGRELLRQVEELTASRARLVEAEENSRRRLERDIHDGVQQDLVALIARIGLARNQLGRGVDALEETLTDLQADAQRVLANVRDLASGIHPSVLDDRGLVEALESRAARLPLWVTIDCEPDLREARFDERIESAAYFVCCEGFANALKHSGAERIALSLRHEGGTLALELCDDGCGFDTGDVGGSGLAGLGDRVDAFGGSFEVESAPGEGTRLRAAFPAPQLAAN
jgi:signal transduction histidine kinase